jgi:hypothetical protein
MKKIKFLTIIFLGIFISQPVLFATPFSISVIEPTNNEWQNHYMISDFIKLKLTDLDKMKGKKMSFLEKIVVKMVQHKMKRYLKKHSDINVAQFIKAQEAEKKKFSFSWFMIGLLSPLIGLFTASTIGIILFFIAPIALPYLIKTTKIEKSSFWAGLLTATIIFLVLLAMASSLAF